VAAATDWDAWHGQYDDPDSPLSRRLRIVQQLIDNELDATASRPISVVSCCAGDGRDLLGVLAARADAQRVTAHLLEQDPQCVARARATVTKAGLPNITVTRTDAARSDAYRGHVPADVVLLCGVLGNIHDDDGDRLAAALPQLCGSGALVIWTRHRRPPDRTPRLRERFCSAGFVEVSFTAPNDVVFSVGAHRYTGPPAALEPGRRLFTFVR
jgi:hypothetical protein